MDNFRLEDAILAVSARVDQLDAKLDSEERARLKDREGVKEFIAGLPYVYVPRAEHRAGKAEAWQVIVAVAAVGGLVLQGALAVFGHH